MPETCFPRVCLLAFALLALAGCGRGVGDVDDARMRGADREPENWLLHAGNHEAHHFSGLTQINDRTVESLAPAWVFEFDTTRGQQSTPIVVDGVMFVTTAMSKVYALDADTGRLRWFHDPKVPGEQAWKACCDVTNRGAAVYKGRVYVATVDGRLLALDADTGAVAWSVVTVDQDSMYAITGAPRVVRDKVIIGNAGADFGVRGYVSAYDADSGKLVWRFYLVPGDPAKGPDGAASDDIMESLMRPTWSGDRYWVYGGGATAWGDMTYDPDFNLLYVGTGNGAPWNRRYRSEGKGDNLFVSSIVALDPDTGRYAWHYQENPGESWDYTSVQPIVLADLTIDGAVRKVLLHAPKNGFFYVIDRSNGRLVSAESYVPTSWATSIDLATGRPVEAPNARYESGPFRTVSAAHSWYPFSYSSLTGLVYFPAHTSATEFRQDDDFRFTAGLTNHGAIHQSFLPLPGEARAPLPGAAPASRDFLLAWDPVRRKEAWRVPVGGYGVLATAGNLVFQGSARAGVMGRLTAFAADSGRELWHHDTPNAILPAPISYAVGGEQYVATVGGARIFAGGGPARVPQPGRVVAFKLGGAAMLPPDPALAPPIRPPDGTWPPETIVEGEKSYARLCARCHGFKSVSPNVIPDLRRSAVLAHADAWKAIVLDGTLAQRGMRGWRPFLDERQAESVRAYVVEQARAGARAAAVPPAAGPAAAAPAVDSPHLAFSAERLMDDVRSYYGFGIHRTGHPGDHRTSQWLVERFRALGLETSIHSFTLRQFFLDEASIEDGRGRIAAFPIWLPRATSPEGLRARLQLVDSATEDGRVAGTIAWLQPGTAAVAEREALLRKAVAAGAAAVLFATSDSAGSGVLVAQNTGPGEDEVERPVPTLTFGASDAARLRESVGREVTVRLTGRFDDGARGDNVLARLVRRPEADWIVVATPASGWFACGGERGPGVALLLALASWARDRQGALNFLFVTTSGHELDFLGARRLHEAGIAPPPSRTRAWLALGTSIATPPWERRDGTLVPTERVTTGTLQADPGFEALLRESFAGLDFYTVSTTNPFGEIREARRRGYRSLGIVGGSDPWHHCERDDPTAVSPATLSAVAKATARALEILDR